MALPTTYSTGTASVTAGDVTVTGQGTTWLTSGIQAGDLFWAAGTDVRIASVNSNTSLTLAFAWPGATRTAAAYEIRFTPDATRVLSSARAVLDALAGGNLFSIGDLDSAADTLPYFTGAGVAGLTDFPAIARTLLAATSAKAQRTAIAVTGEARVTDANAVEAGQRCFFNGTDDQAVAGNLPSLGAGSTTRWWYIDTIGNPGVAVGSRTAQFATEVFGAGTVRGRTFVRQLHDGAWQPWREIYTQASAVGTVSVSGSTPTGALIEKGSNANGSYDRFASGLQICRNGQLSFTFANNRRLQTTWTFPAAFAGFGATVLVSLSAASADYIGMFTNRAFPTWHTTSNTSAQVGVNNVVDDFVSTNQINNCQAVAIGRWM